MENRIADLKALRVKISLPEAQVLMQREGTVLDLKNEIEKTFAKIFPHSSKNPISSIKRDKGKVILPFWHPVDPLLTDNEEVVVEFGSLNIADNAPDKTGMCNNCGCCTFIRDLMGNKRSDLNSTSLDRIPSEPSIADQEFTAGHNLESARVRKRKVLSPDTTVSDQHHMRVIQTSFEDDLESLENLPSPSKKARGNEKSASKKKRNFYGRELLGSVSWVDSVKHPPDITVPNADVVSDPFESSPVLSDTVILSRASSDITIGQSIEHTDVNNRTASFGILNMDVGVEKNVQNASNVIAEENNLNESNERIEREKLISSIESTEKHESKLNNSKTPSKSKGEKTGSKQEKNVGIDLDLSLSMLDEGDISKPLGIEKEIREIRANKKIANLHKESSGIEQVERAGEVEQSGEDEIMKKDEINLERKRKKKRKKKDKDLERVASSQSQDTIESEFGSEKRKRKDKDLEKVASSQSQDTMESEFGCEKRKKKDKDLEKVALKQSQDTIESEFESESTSYKVQSQQNKDLKNESASDLNQDELLSSSFPLISEVPTVDENEELGSHRSGKKKKKKKRKSKEVEIGRSFDDSNSQSCDTSMVHTEESSAKLTKKKSKSKRSNAFLKQFIIDANDVFDDESEDMKTAKTMNSCGAASKNQSDTLLFKIPKPKTGSNTLKENTVEPRSIATNAVSLHDDNNKQSLKSTKRKQDDESCDGIPGNVKECKLVGSKKEEKLCFDDETDAEILAIQSNIKSITDAVHESDYSSTIDLPLEFKKKTRRSKGRRSKSICDKKEENSELSSAGITQNKQGAVADEQPGKALEDRGGATTSEPKSVEIKSQNKSRSKKSKSEKGISSPEKDESSATHSQDKKLASGVRASDLKSEASSRNQAKGKKKEAGSENKKKRIAVISSSSETSSISFSDVSAKIVPKKSKSVAANASLTKKNEEHGSKIPGGVKEKEKPDDVANVANAKSAKTSKEKRSRRRSRSSRSSGFKEACVTKVSAWLSQIPDGNHECPTADGHDEREDSGRVKIGDQAVSSSQNASFTILETKITDEVVKPDRAVRGNVIDKSTSRNSTTESKIKKKNKENDNPKSDKRDSMNLSLDKTQSASRGYKDEDDSSDDNSEDNDENITAVKDVVKDSKVASGEITNGRGFSSRIKTRASNSAQNPGRKESADERGTENKSKNKKFTKPINTRLKSTTELNASFENSQLKFDSLLDDGASVISSNVPAAPAKKSVTPGFVQRSISGFLTNADRKRFQNKMKSQSHSKTEE